MTPLSIRIYLEHLCIDSPTEIETFGLDQLQRTDFMVFLFS